jgi:hypothetical protein
VASPLDALDLMPWRPVLVGQAPGPRSDPRYPLLGGHAVRSAGARLQALMGLGLVEYARLFCRRNLLEAWPGHAGKGDRWPAGEAAKEAGRLAQALRGRTVLLLGRNVAGAFGRTGPYLEWVDDGVRMAAILPHPSGVNLWWNDPANEARGRVFLADLVRAARAARATAAARGAARGLDDVARERVLSGAWTPRPAN